MSAHRHALYRYYGDDGTLLYVGITNDMSRRMDQHAGTKTWWQEIRGVSIEWYDTREAVEAAERRAIDVEQPRYNIQHRRKATTPPSHQTRSEFVALKLLIWNCDVCGDPVGNGDDGYLHVDRGAAMQLADEKVKDERLRYAESPFGGDLTEERLALWDREIPWEVHHRRCDPKPIRDDYWAYAGRFRTAAQLLDWTLHLSEKDWPLAATNWRSFLRKALIENGQAIDA